MNYFELVTRIYDVSIYLKKLLRNKKEETENPLKIE